HFVERGGQPRLQGADAFGFEVDRTAAGPDDAAAETVPAEQRREVEEVPADPAARGGGRQEGDVPREGAEVARVVCESLEFQRDRADPLGAERRLGSGQGLENGGMGRCMTDRRVARGGFHMEDRCAMGSAGERLLDAAMLVAERDLEMKNLLARAL